MVRPSGVYTCTALPAMATTSLLVGLPEPVRDME